MSKLDLLIVRFLCFVFLFKPLPLPALTLDFSTYLGGSGTDSAYGIAVDSAGLTYVTGATGSSNFPTQNSYQSGPQGGSGDIFITVLDSSGSELLYSTYLGGNLADIARGITVDSDGDFYLTGYTSSSNFPVRNAYQQSRESGDSIIDAFVTKFASTGSTILYSTYLGGSESEISYGITVKTGGIAYISGVTNSEDFPTRDAYQSTHSGSLQDGFVSIFSSDGSCLVYSTYLGGSGDDGATGVALDYQQAIWLTGWTDSTDDFPTAGDPYQGSRIGAEDVFVSRFTSDGSILSYSTYLGGSLDDHGFGIDVNFVGDAYVAGYSYSRDFPTRNAFQTTKENEYVAFDAFVTKFNSGGDLDFSTYLGGGSRDQAFGITVDSIGAAYVTGETFGYGFPVKDAYQSTHNGPYEGTDAFVSKFSADGDLVYSTYLGGAANDGGQTIVADNTSNTYVAGTTSSVDFPTCDAYQVSLAGGIDVFVSKFLRPPTPTPSSTPTPSPTLTPTPTPSVTPTVTPSTTPTLTPTATPSTTPSSSPTPTPTPTSSVTPTFTPTPTCGPTVPITRLGIESGDYDGDGTDEIALFRDSSGLWAVRAVSRSYFGSSGDQPVAGDYDGDRTTEFAIFRSGSGMWGIKDLTRILFGSSGDLPCPGDYEGDGTVDVGIFCPSSGLWAVRTVTRVFFGTTGDWPISGDFNGSGRGDIGIYRDSSGLWAIRGITRAYFGGGEAWALPGDYDGDGIWEIAVFRAHPGVWAIRGSTRIWFGICLDWPVPADFSGDSTDDLGIFRPQSGLWAVRGLTRLYCGGVGDFPATR